MQLQVAPQTLCEPSLTRFYIFKTSHYKGKRMQRHIALVSQSEPSFTRFYTFKTSLKENKLRYALFIYL